MTCHVLHPPDVMLKKYLYIAILLLLAKNAGAQQFIGNIASEYTAIQSMPYNPAWVNNSDDGMEIHALSLSVLAGTNAYYFRKGWILGGANGQAKDAEYTIDERRNIKHMWANIDLLGPMVSFTYKREHHFGIYTRYRQIARGGNLSSSELALLGASSNDSLLFGHAIDISNAGFTNYTFGEIGFSYGKILVRDDYHFLKVGGTLKYLIGFAAASIYANSFTYQRADADSIGTLKGDITALYTYNLNPLIDNDVANDRASWFDRGGRGGLGIDLGVQYQYHPNGNPNEKTQYLFSLAASLTDIGSIGYVADTGSANYEVRSDTISKNAIERLQYEDIGWYFVRQVEDGVLYVNEPYRKFRVGLPAAFRINCDWNVLPKFNVAVNIMLNMKGNNGKVYNPGYVSYFNLTPSYTIKSVRVGLPMTFSGYRTGGLGLVLRAGPFYFGSTSLVSSIIMANNWIRNIDGYFGFTFKLHKEEDSYWYR